MFKKGDIVEYKPTPKKYGTGIVVRDQVRDIVEVDFVGLKQGRYRAFYYNLRLIEKAYKVELENSLFEI